MFTEAKQDCDAALRLEPANKKAFYRRALANKGLKVNGAGLKDSGRDSLFIIWKGIGGSFLHQHNL